MDNLSLQRAKKLEQEIKELESFINTASMVWTGKIVKKECKYIFKSNPYGYFESKEYEMDTDIKNKVLDVLRDHLKELEHELEIL